jgi:hypothetical protein
VYVQLIKKFLAFHRTQKFIIKFITAYRNDMNIKQSHYVPWKLFGGDEV